MTGERINRKAGYELDLSLSTVYILELYHVASPHLQDSAPPMKGEGHGQAIACDHGASNYVTGRKRVWLPGRLLFRSKIILRGSIGSEQSVHYSELRGVRSSEVRNVLNLWQIQSVP